MKCTEVCGERFYVVIASYAEQVNSFRQKRLGFCVASFFSELLLHFPEIT